MHHSEKYKDMEFIVERVVALSMESRVIQSWLSKELRKEMFEYSQGIIGNGSEIIYACTNKKRSKKKKGTHKHPTIIKRSFWKVP